MADNTSIPGGVYLCQVNETISCGACCGLYNVANASYKAMTEMLTYRTEIFATIPRNMEAILTFKEKIEQRETQERPFPEFHHCPFIGLIGEEDSRVGCLLHPLAKGNNGVDFRGLSFYGGMACNVYFCPTHRYLPIACKEILRDIAEDWYLYGLVITETKMLNAFFQEVEKQLGNPLDKTDILENETRKTVIREFLNLKVGWQFRSERRPLGNYFFEDHLYPKPLIDYEAIGASVSKYDTILQELGSDFNSPEKLHKAEAILDQLFERL